MYNNYSNFSKLPDTVNSINWKGKQYIPNGQYLDYLQSLDVRPIEEYLGGEIENTVNPRKLNLGYVQGLTNTSPLARVFPVLHRFKQLPKDTDRYNKATEETLARVKKLKANNNKLVAGTVATGVGLGGAGYIAGTSNNNKESKYSYMAPVVNFSFVGDAIEGVNSFPLDDFDADTEDFQTFIKNLRLDAVLKGVVPYEPREYTQKVVNADGTNSYLDMLENSPLKWQDANNSIGGLPIGKVVYPVVKAINDSQHNTLRSIQEANLDPEKLDIPQKVQDYVSQIELPKVTFPELNLPNLPHIPIPNIDLSNVHIPNPLPLVRDTIEAGVKGAETVGRMVYNTATNPLTLPPPLTIGGVGALNTAKGLAIQSELKKRQAVNNQAVKNYMGSVNTLQDVSNKQNNLVRGAAATAIAAPITGMALGRLTTDNEEVGN